MVGKSDFNENPVVSLDLDFDLGFVNMISYNDCNNNVLTRPECNYKSHLSQTDTIIVTFRAAIAA